MIKDSTFINQTQTNNQPEVEISETLKPKQKVQIYDEEISKEDKIDVSQKEFINSGKEDLIKNKIYNFLLREGIIIEKEGMTVVDMKKLEDGNFKEFSRDHRWGKIGDKSIYGSRKIVYEKFRDLEGVLISDFIKIKEDGKKIAPYKIFEQHDTVREKLIEFLQQEKILENIDGYNIFDLKKFFNPGFIVNKLQHKHLGNIDGKKVQGSYKILFEQLGDMPIVSKEDFIAQKGKGEEIETKPLFNIPDSINNALDLKNVNKDDYYLNYWDLRDSSRARQINWQYKIKLKNGEEIGADEFALFTKIFKDYQGERNKNGALQVYDKTQQKYVRPSVDWIKANIGGFGGAPSKGTDITSSPHEFLLNKCQNLVNKDLIKLSDFKIKTNDKSGNLLRREFTGFNKKNSYVPMKSIRYYIGKENFIFEGKSIPTENIKVVVLDNEKLGIIKSYQGLDTLLFTLNLLNEEEKKKNRQEIIDRKGNLPEKKITSLAIVKSEEVKKRINHWSPLVDNPPKEGEKIDEYNERIRYIGSYENLKKTSDDFSKECKIGIHNLSWREQQWLCGAMYELGPENKTKLLEFGKQYGLEGLKVFLSCEQNINNHQKILNIGKLLEKQLDVASVLFSEYAQLTDKTEQAAEEMSRLYNEIFFEKQVNKNEVVNAILKRASQLLVDAEEKLKDTPENDKQALIKELIEELVREQIAQARILEDFKNIAQQLNTKYQEIDKSWTGIIHQEDKEKISKDLAGKMSKDEINDYLDYLDDQFENPIKPEAAGTIKEYETAIDLEEKHKKFDANRLKERIEELESIYITPSSESISYQLLLNRGHSKSDADNIFIAEQAEARKKFEPYVKKIYKLLKLQGVLENKMDQIIYGKKQTEDSNNLEQSTPEAILNKYQELIDLTNKNKKELAGLFKKEVNINDADLNNVTNSILLKAKECLGNFNELVQKGKEVNETEILKKLEKYKKDLILTVSVLKSLDVKLEDIEGVNIEQVTAAQMAFSPRAMAVVEKELKTSNNLAMPASALKREITKAIKDFSNEERKSIDEIVQMLYIYEENYKHKPEFRDKLLPGFIDKLKNGGDNVRIYKILQDGQLIAFYRFDDKPDGDKYFGSFNVNPVMQGSKIGTALMEKSLKDEGAGCNIEADSDPETLICSKYIEDEGFIATKVLKNYGGSKYSVFNIHRRDENKKYYYRDKDYKKGEIIKQYEKDFGGCNTARPENKVIFKFNTPEEMLASIEDLVNNGYAVTRYFYEDAKKSQAVYCALERSPN